MVRGSRDTTATTEPANNSLSFPRLGRSDLPPSIPRQNEIANTDLLNRYFSALSHNHSPSNKAEKRIDTPRLQILRIHGVCLKINRNIRLKVNGNDDSILPLGSPPILLMLNHLSTRHELRNPLFSEFYRRNLIRRIKIPKLKRPSRPKLRPKSRLRRPMDYFSYLG